jgi:O-antigen/teichoic acid export membrane protein
MVMESNKIINNAKWIIVCKIAQSLLQLIIGMFSARYLGPANYGLINYAGSIVAFMVPLTQLGLNATLVRELIDYPDEEGTIMGTSMVMGVISSVCCVAMVAGFVSVTNPTEPQTLIVCVLYSLCLIFRAIELIQYWFHGKLKAKYPSIMMVCAYVLVSVYKIYLLISQKDIFWFAVVHAIEYGIVGLGLLVIALSYGAITMLFKVKGFKYLINIIKR